METNDKEWIYYKIYLNQEKYGDLAVEKIVKPAAEHLRKFCVKWFFIKYLDETGYHIRIRFLTPVDNIEYVCNYLEELIESNLEQFEKMKIEPISRLVPTKYKDLNNGTLESHFELAIYEPEVKKYGGISGLKYAEDIFQISSEFCVNLVPYMNTKKINRFDIGLKTMNIFIKSYLNESEYISFLEEYVSYWCGEKYDESRKEIKRSFLNAAFLRQEATESIINKSLGDIDSLLFDFEKDVLTVTQLIRQDKQVQESMSHLCFHYIHMMNNRLGIWTIEEAYLAALLLSFFKKKKGRELDGILSNN